MKPFSKYYKESALHFNRVNEAIDLYNLEYIYLFVHMVASMNNIKFKFEDTGDKDITSVSILCDSPTDAAKLSKNLNIELKKLINLSDDEADELDAVASIFKKHVKTISDDDNHVIISVE